MTKMKDKFPSTCKLWTASLQKPRNILCEWLTTNFSEIFNLYMTLVKIYLNFWWSEEAPLTVYLYRVLPKGIEDLDCVNRSRFAWWIRFQNAQRICSVNIKYNLYWVIGRLRLTFAEVKYIRVRRTLTHFPSLKTQYTLLANANRNFSTSSKQLIF